MQNQPRKRGIEVPDKHKISVHLVAPKHFVCLLLCFFVSFFLYFIFLYSSISLSFFLCLFIVTLVITNNQGNSQQLLCILNSERVLCALFTCQNSVFQHFCIFVCQKKRKMGISAQKGEFITKKFTRIKVILQNNQTLVDFWEFFFLFHLNVFKNEPFFAKREIYSFFPW